MTRISHSDFDSDSWNKIDKPEFVTVYFSSKTRDVNNG